MLDSKLRITAGLWRGRQVQFKVQDGIRPTPSRVRETLFNWLQSDIQGAACLDLFAGSGILGLEALSRGADNVLAVDYSKVHCQQLAEMQRIFNCDLTVLHGDWQQSLARLQKQFDGVFLDPPYAQALLTPCLQALHQGQMLKDGAWLYIEHNAAFDTQAWPPEYELKRAKRAGRVFYGLLHYRSSR